MPLVELTGPPAVGKSALVTACVRHGAQDARRSVLRARWPLLSRDRHPRRGSGQSTGAGRRVADRFLRGPSEAEVEQALTAVVPDWAPFLEFVLSSSAPHAGTGGPELVVALMERGWMLDALRLRALVDAHRRSSNLLLLDEGLTHPYKARAVVGASADDALDRYAALVPLPDVLVVLDDDTEAVVRRLRERHRAGAPRARWSALGDAPDDAVVAAEVERTRRAIEVIADGAAARGRDVIRLRTSGASTDQLAQRLMAELRASHADGTGS